jgi:hypothetical protein
MHDFFCDTNIKLSDEFISKIKNYIQLAKDDDWKSVIEMNLLQVPKEFFETEPVLMKIIKEFKAETRLSVYKTSANTSYFWHRDKIRAACLNVLLEGYDSMCLFAKAPDAGMMQDLTKLPYEPGKVFLLNVSHLHTVLNFSQDRYLLSIGIPRPASFKDVSDYINKEV